jgi:hypothetical protein
MESLHDNESKMDFSKRVAVLAGAGLVRSNALELAWRGAHVIVNELGGSAGRIGQSHTAAEAVAAQIKADGGTAVFNHGSVAIRADDTRIIAREGKDFGIFSSALLPGRRPAHSASMTR